MRRVIGAAVCLAALLPWSVRADAGRASAPLSRAAGAELGWASVKATRAFGRAGPSFDHPVLWVYERRGLPVRVIEITRDWRKVEDPDGAKVWVHRRLLSRRRTLMARGSGGGPLVLRAAPDGEAAVIALLGHGVTAELRGCGPDWCEVAREDLSGWALKRDFVGADAGERF